MARPQIRLTSLFLFKWQSALSRLGLSNAGHKMLVSMVSERSGELFDPVRTLILPEEDISAAWTPVFKSGFSAILAIYADLLPRLSLADKLKVARQEGGTAWGRYMRAMGIEDAKFKRLATGNDFGWHYVQYEKGDGVRQTIIHDDHRRAIRDAATSNARKVIRNRLIHNKIQDVGADVDLALDVVLLSLGAAEFQGKLANGAITWRDHVNQNLALVGIANNLATRYVLKTYGEEAGKVALKQLVRVGAITNMISGAVTFSESADSYTNGNYKKAHAQLAAATMGLAAGGVALFMTTPPGWLIAALALAGAAAGALSSSYTLDEVEEFLKYCEFGKGGDNDMQLAQKPKFSRYTFGEWQGNLARQRDALSRVMCAFELESMGEE